MTRLFLRGALLILPWIAFLSTGVPVAHAQGCSACRDDTAGSALPMRRSLRKAIPILGIPAAILFAGILVVAVKTRPGNSE
jgi:hypothetical protein